MNPQIFEYYGTDWVMMITTVVAFFVGISSRSKIKNRSLSLIILYIGLAVMFDVLSILAELVFKSQLLAGFASKMYALLEPIIFLWFIRRNLVGKARKWLLSVIIILFFLFFFLFVFTRSKLAGIRTYGEWISYESFFVVLGALVYFHQLFTTKYFHPIKDQPEFWMITGILFYNASSIPIFLLRKYASMYTPYPFSLALEMINYILYTLLFSIFIRGFLCSNKANYTTRIPVSA